MRSMTVFNYLLEATVIGSVIILLVIAVRALLRDRIISACDHYFEKGFAPVYARENITSMYDAYHSLGGDGIVTDMVKQAMELPYKKGGEAPVEQSRESRAAINTSRRNEV